MSVQLDHLLQHPALWRVGDVPAPLRAGVSTGYGALDAVIPEAGWPVGALTEILAHEGMGEFSLVMPALRAVCAEGKHLALIGAPYVIYARALEAAGLLLPRVLIVEAAGVDALWAAEQALRTGACGMVLLWATRGHGPNYRSLQRLNGAAAQGGAICLLYRHPDARLTPSPAPVRVACRTQRGEVAIEIVKCRGVLNSRPIVLTPFPPHWSRAHAPAAVALPSLVSATSRTD